MELSDLFSFWFDEEDDALKNEVIFSFNSLDEFYKETFNLDIINGRAVEFQQYETFDFHNSDPDFRFTKEFIETNKWGYKDGLKELRKLKNKLDLIGGSNFKTKWDYLDGDDMHIDRFYDDIPFLKKKIRTVGHNSGKFVNININIAVSSCISNKQLLYKAYSTVSLVDYIEQLGYRTSIIVFNKARRQGTYKGEKMSYTTTKVVIKKENEPLNLSLLLTVVSPWMLRYWFFKFWYSKFKTSGGLGYPTYEYLPNTKNEIWIKSMDFLDEQSFKTKMEELKNLFIN